MKTDLLAPDLNHVIEQTHDFWDELRGERIFLTGGTGFVGCWLLESFLWARNRFNINTEITLLTRNPDAFTRKAPHLAQSEGIRLLTGDIRNFDFPAGSFSHVIHAAADTNLNLEDKNSFATFDTILNGTHRTLEFSHTHGVRRFLYVSTGAVYGTQPLHLQNLPEDFLGAPDPMNRASTYGLSKLLGEHLCILTKLSMGNPVQPDWLINSSDIQIKIARLFSFVGPSLPLNSRFAIGNFIRDGLNGGPIKIHGDGTSERSYLYAADLAIWLWTILFRGCPSHPYNVGSEQVITISDLAKIVSSQFQPVPKILFSEPSILNQPSGRYVPSTRRAFDELGLKQSIELESAIKKTIQYYQRS